MSNNVNNTNAESNTKRQPMYIEITQPEKFEALAATTMETTQRLAKRINKLFSTAFADYHGSAVYCMSGNGNVAQQFMVELHFKPLTVGSLNPSDTRVRAFKPIEEGTAKSDVVANLKKIYGNLRTSARFELTSEASEILSEFMMNGTVIDPFNPQTYNQYKAEYQDNTTFGQAPVMVKIMNLDLNKLIRKIYGNKNEEGKKVDYGVIPYGPVAPTANMAMNNNANWRVIIMQIEAEKTFDLATEFGLIPPSNGNAGGVIITGTV